MHARQRVNVEHPDGPRVGARAPWIRGGPAGPLPPRALEAALRIAGVPLPAPDALRPAGPAPLARPGSPLLRAGAPAREAPAPRPGSPLLPADAPRSPGSPGVWIAPPRARGAAPDARPASADELASWLDA